MKYKHLFPFPYWTGFFVLDVGKVPEKVIESCRICKELEVKIINSVTWLRREWMAKGEVWDNSMVLAWDVGVHLKSLGIGELASRPTVRVGVGCLEPHTSKYDVVVFSCIVGYNIRLRVSRYSQLAIYPATPGVNMYKQGGLVCLLTFSLSWCVPGAPL